MSSAATESLASERAAMVQTLSDFVSACWWQVFAVASNLCMTAQMKRYSATQGLQAALRDQNLTPPLGYNSFIAGGTLRNSCKEEQQVKARTPNVVFAEFAWIDVWAPIF